VYLPSSISVSIEPGGDAPQRIPQPVLPYPQLQFSMGSILLHPAVLAKFYLPGHGWFFFNSLVFYFQFHELGVADHFVELGVFGLSICFSFLSDIVARRFLNDFSEYSNVKVVTVQHGVNLLAVIHYSSDFTFQ
jgi:hypothetical protein